MNLIEQMEALTKALKEGGYNVAPSKLRQGCILLVLGPDATEADYERAWAEIDAEHAAREK